MRAKKRKVTTTANKRAAKSKLTGLSRDQLKKIYAINKVRSTVTGTRIFDRTVHKTNIWLKDVMRALGWENREHAYQALRATLHSVRDVLTFEEAVQLGAQLPILLRGVYYEGWSPNKGQMRLKTVGEFFLLVRIHLGPSTKFNNADIRGFTHGCLQVIAKHISKGEMQEVKAVLPKKLKGLVPEPQSEGWESMIWVA